MTVNGQTILCIDDDSLNRDAVGDYLEDSGYKVLRAENGRVGLELYQSHRPDLILLDLRMPEVDGLEVLARIRVDNDETPVIVISGEGNIKDAIGALRLGAWDYHTKPIQDLAVLEHSIESCMERVRLLRENRIYKEHLEQEVKQRTAELKELFMGAVNCVTGITGVRDLYTHTHQKRVSELAVFTAVELSMSEDEIETIRIAGLLHDVGKIGIPLEILSKPGKLTAIEYGIVQTHSESGYSILKRIPFRDDVPEIVLQHHENMDGSGYPRQLDRDYILPKAALIHVCDVVEAMISHRPFRPALTVDQALEEIRQQRDIRFDSDCVDACLRVFETRREEILLRLDECKIGF